MSVEAPVQRPIPVAPFLLGLGGLVPFWGLAIGVCLHGFAGYTQADLDRALVVYAAIIVSFLGGIRWGFAVADEAKADYALSVVPSLVAWALVAVPEPWRCAGLGLFLMLLGPFDAATLPGPRWFGRLRLILSVGAAVALLLAALSLR